MPVFVDNVTSRFYKGWTTAVLSVSLFFGWSLCIGVVAYDSCYSVSLYLIILSVIFLISLPVVQQLRFRTVSLMERQEMVWKLAGAIFLGLSSLACIALIIVLIVKMADTWDDASCQTSRLVGTCIVLIIGGVIWTLLQLCVTLWIVYQRLVFLKPPPCPYGEWGKDVVWLRTSRGHFIPAVFYAHPDAKFTVLYSHGNAVDLGQLLQQQLLKGICDELHVNVMGYDYPGYGFASGYPSERQVYDGIRTSYEALQSKYRIPAHQIVLWGRSMGTGATIDLASKLAKTPDRLAAIILESPLLSIIRTTGCCKAKTRWFDMFPSIDKIASIVHPIYITHGRADTVVPFWHGQQLHQLCRNPYPAAWIDALGHNDMPDVWQYRRPVMAAGESQESHDKKIAETNHLNELNRQHRDRLRQFLDFVLRQQAPEEKSPAKQKQKPQSQGDTKEQEMVTLPGVTGSSGTSESIIRLEVPRQATRGQDLNIMAAISGATNIDPKMLEGRDLGNESSDESSD